MSALVPIERIERTILLIRGHKVMLDSDLARLYQVTAKGSTSKFAGTPSAFLPISCFSSRRRSSIL